MALRTPINVKDIALQALTDRGITSNPAFISLQAPYVEFLYGPDNIPVPPTIPIFAQLVGGLQGTVVFSVTGLTTGTNFSLDSSNLNILVLDPSTFAGRSVTITASLKLGVDTIESAPLTIRKRDTALVATLTRSSDNLLRNIITNTFDLPTDSNTLELRNNNIKVSDAIYGIEAVLQSTNSQSQLVSTQTIDGLTLTINSSTGLITLTDTDATSGYKTWVKTNPITFKLTAASGLEILKTSYTISKVTGTDLRVPPTPAGNIEIIAGFSYVSIKLDSTDLAYTTAGKHAKTLVYAQEIIPAVAAAAEIPEVPATETLAAIPAVPAVVGVEGTTELLESAELVTEIIGNLGTFNAKPGTRYRIWLKYQTVDGIVSNPAAFFGSEDARYAETGVDVDALVKTLTGPGNPFTILKNAERRDGVNYPAGTYTTNAFIMDAQITKAKIGIATIDSANIKDLDAGLLTAGTGIIGDTLRSANYTEDTVVNGVTISGQGWALRNGALESHLGKPSAELPATSIRGKLTAQQIDARGLTIRRESDNSIILDATQSILEQIPRYSPDATFGPALNLNPSFSNEAAWDKNYVYTIADGVTGNKVLRGNQGEHLLEGITTLKAVKIPYDAQKVYQLSALIRKQSGTNGTVSPTAIVNIGLLEFDANDVPQYNWGGYVLGKIIASDITTEFTRKYALLAPGDLNSGTAKMAVHVVLAYGNQNLQYGIEVQDIRLDDITLEYRAFQATVATASTDASFKLLESKDYTNTTESDIRGSTLSNQEDQIMRPGFVLKTPRFTGTYVGTVYQAGRGIAISENGIIAKKNDIPTFALDIEGNATFSGILNVTNSQDSRVTINNEVIEVWNNGVKRVVLGKLN